MNLPQLQKEVENLAEQKLHSDYRRVCKSLKELSDESLSVPVGTFRNMMRVVKPHAEISEETSFYELFELASSYEQIRKALLPAYVAEEIKILLEKTKEVK